MSQTVVGNVIIDTNEELEQLTKDYKEYISREINKGSIKSKRDVLSFNEFVQNKKREVDFYVNIKV